MKKILITGSNGFLGYNLSIFFSRIKNKKFHITASYNSKKANLSKRIKTLKLNSKTLLGISKNISYDIVIHCASKTRVNTKNNLNLYLENLKFLKMILKKIDFKYFFFMSSMSVYGKVNASEITETTMLKAKDYYGKSKIECEKILEKFIKKNPNKKVIIFRLPGVIGYKSHSNFISNLLSAFKNNKNNQIQLININDKFNNIIHVKDLFNFICELILKKIKKNFLVFVLGSKLPLKIRKNIIKIFELSFKKKINYSILNKKNKNKLINYTKSKKYNFKSSSTLNSILLMIKDNSKIT